jgi:serine protease AprX
MNAYYHSATREIILFFALELLSAGTFLQGQGVNYSYFYRVYFKDKGENSTLSISAKELISARAIERRQKSGIFVPDYNDLPVYNEYLHQISIQGLVLHCTSKWINTALFKSPTPVDLNLLLELPFVNEVRMVKSPGSKSSFKNKLYFVTEQSDIPSYDRPITMVNGSLLPQSGYDGKNILIAVLDGGFINTDAISSLDPLRSRNGILCTHDFVKNNGDVYNSSQHGTAVLSILAGNLPGLLEGSAQGADYLLLKTEDVESEFPCEEDFWAAGAEFADSSGADIISSSLGYFTFDDSTLNYKTSDLNGKTAFITRAAEIAASKGILVVNSAGNERNNKWKYIIFPSDGDSVLAVGAVDGNEVISSFSSTGPTTDGRVKPDNVAMGASVPIQISGTSVSRSNGTSFSCPIISGMSACLMQAVPGVTGADVMLALRMCADRYDSPDSLYGYGIPDIILALSKLQDKYVKPLDEGIIIAPNPTSGNIELIFRQPPESFTIEIINLAGKLIFRKDFTEYAVRVIRITDLNDLEQGIYFIRILTSNGIIVKKIIKLRN